MRSNGILTSFQAQPDVPDRARYVYGARSADNYYV